MELKETEITEKKIRANAELWAAYKAKDREWKHASRKKVLSPMEAEKERIKCRERVRLHRLEWCFQRKGALLSLIVCQGCLLSQLHPGR